MEDKTTLTGEELTKRFKRTLKCHWKKIGEHTPKNKNGFYPGSHEATYINCLVWVRKDNKPGFCTMATWNTQKNKFTYPDFGDTITHFCEVEEINAPNDAQ